MASSKSEMSLSSIELIYLSLLVLVMCRSSVLSLYPLPPLVDDSFFTNFIQHGPVSDELKELPLCIIPLYMQGSTNNVTLIED